MKKIQVLILIVSLLLLSACQSEGDGNLAERPPLNEKKEQSGGDGSPQADRKVNSTKEMKPIEEINEKALYKWDVDEGTAIFLLNEMGGIEEFDGDYAIGSQGERQYNGDVALYVVPKGEKNGYLQTRMKDVYLNLDRAFSDPYDFKDGKLIAWVQPEASNVNTLTMWHYQNGALERVLFDDDEAITVSHSKMKLLKDDFLQTYAYNNFESDEGGIGWYYTTWKWDDTAGKFGTYHEKQYTDDVYYGWETGERTTKDWHENNDDYVLFPELTITETILDHIKEGKLVEEGVRLDQSIDSVLAVSPTYKDHDYYEGGRYYSIPGPFTYFYNEGGTRGVSFITLSGASLTNDLESIKDLFGEPESSYGPEDDDGTMMVDYYWFNYLIGDKQLRVEYDENERISGLWLSGNWQ